MAASDPAAAEPADGPSSTPAHRPSGPHEPEVNLVIERTRLTMTDDQFLRAQAVVETADRTGESIGLRDRVLEAIADYTGEGIVDSCFKPLARDFITDQVTRAAEALLRRPQRAVDSPAAGREEHTPTERVTRPTVGRDLWPEIERPEPTSRPSPVRDALDDPFDIGRRLF